MTFILGAYTLIISAKILVTKFNKTFMWICCGFLLLGLMSSVIWDKNTTFYNFIFLVSSITLIFSVNQVWVLQIKRKFYTLPAVVFQIPLLLIPLYRTQMSPRLSFLVFGFSFVTGLLLDHFFSSPHPFFSYFEFNFYRSKKNKSKLPVVELQSYLENNLGNFVLGQIFIKNYNTASESDKRQFKKELLPSLLTYWVSNKSFTSMCPMAKSFNQLSLADIKESFTYYDLNNRDLPWIHDMFRCGCWKVGLYLLDQYLLTNKQSKMYASSLLWSDRILNDLKRASFDDETIENWLMDYRERFHGTPLSVKIQLVYHNKDDWFEKSYRFAAL